MSTYRPKDRPFYLYDFQYAGRRFCGSTGCTSKRDAELFEKQARAEVKKEVEQQRKLGRGPMTFGAASTRFWDEVAQHSATADDAERSLIWLQREIGLNTPMSEIDDNKVARLVAKRRMEINPRSGKLIAPGTVNRSMTDVLRRIHSRARKIWKEPLPEIHWGTHRLKEPTERVRELSAEEEKILFRVLRPDYHAIFHFALMTGCRLSECTGLTWARVDWGASKVWINGKGGRVAPIPMPPKLRVLLASVQGQHPEHVFTYVSRYTRTDGTGTRRKGERYPITNEGVQDRFKLEIKPAIPDYHFHDCRHTAATRLLRSSGNIRAAKEMLRHTQINTTMRYAHVTHDDLMGAMEAAIQVHSSHEVPSESPVADVIDPAPDELSI
jgi:integrase